MRTPAAPGRAVTGKSQGRIVWEQFRKHHIALVGLVVLALMYLAAAFAGFLRPYGMNEYRRSPVSAFMPPTNVHWTDPETGRLTRPFVYAVHLGAGPGHAPAGLRRGHRRAAYPIEFLVRRPDQPYTASWESGERPAAVRRRGAGPDLPVGHQLARQGPVLAGAVRRPGVAHHRRAGGVGVADPGPGLRRDRRLLRRPESTTSSCASSRCSTPSLSLFLLIVLATLLKDPRNPLALLFGLQMTSAQTFLMVVMVLGFVGWGGLARTIRSLVLTLREMDYAQAAKALGASEARIMFRHLLPATASYVMVVLTLAIPGFILAEVGLSFLGLGPSELDSASWGLLLRDATARGVSIQFVPWLLIPGIPIFLAVLCWNLVGDGLRDAFDPKKRR
jgi:peptide/nickel transport system permease protein